MRTRTLALAPLLAVLIAPAAATAATPVFLGKGLDPAVTVDPTGAAHVAWELPLAAGRSGVGYCKLARGATACTPQTITTDDVGDLNVFVKGSTVEVYGLDNDCGLGQIIRLASTGGAPFTGGCTSSSNPSPITRGENLLDGFGRFLGASNGSDDAFLALPPGGAKSMTTAIPIFPDGHISGISLAKTGTGAQGRLVAASTVQLEGVDVSVFPQNPDEVPLASTESLNTLSNWTVKNQRVAGTQKTGDGASLAGGAGGIFLANDNGINSLDDKIDVRRFDPTSNSFGGPVSIDGNPAYDRAMNQPSLFEDGSASGTLHLIWGAGDRLRYARSTDGGKSFTVLGTLAAGGIDFHDVAAAADGQGFAVYSGFSAQNNVYAVPLDAVPDAAVQPPGTVDPGEDPPFIEDPDGEGGSFHPPLDPGTQPKPKLKSTTVSASGGRLTFQTPRGCVPPGGTFTATLKFAKQKKKGNVFVKVFRVDFSGTGIRTKIDRKAPFKKTLRVKVGTKRGAKVGVRARAFNKVKKGRGPKKSIRASVRVCG